MAGTRLIEYSEATPEVRAVFDDIKRTRNVPDVNNFWKAIANHPPTLTRTWESLKNVMATGALDPLVKEMLYIAVSITNNCEYCIHSHTAAARGKGMTPAMFHELLAVVALANETNRFANGYRIDVDERFQNPLGGSRRAQRARRPRPKVEARPEGPVAARAWAADAPNRASRKRLREAAAPERELHRSA